MEAIHLKTALKILNEGKPVTLKVLTAKGELRVYENCVALPHKEKTTYRNIRLPASGQIRKIRDILIIGLNDLEVYF